MNDQDQGSTVGRDERAALLRPVLNKLLHIFAEMKEKRERLIELFRALAENVATRAKELFESFDFEEQMVICLEVRRGVGETLNFARAA